MNRPPPQSLRNRARSDVPDWPTVRPPRRDGYRQE